MRQRDCSFGFCSNYFSYLPSFVVKDRRGVEVKNFGVTKEFTVEGSILLINIVIRQRTGCRIVDWFYISYQIIGISIFQ